MQAVLHPFKDKVSDVAEHFSGITTFPSDHNLLNLSNFSSSSCTLEGVLHSNSCHFCGKHCETPSQLAVHLRAHTGERPFYCPHCDYRATQKHHIKSHIQRKHKPLPVEYQRDYDIANEKTVANK